jgi:hypothetical protein
MINGHPATVFACKEWGVIVLPDGVLMPTNQYPLISLASLDQVPEEGVPPSPGNNPSTPSPVAGAATSE